MENYTVTLRDALILLTKSAIIGKQKQLEQNAQDAGII